MTTRPQAIAGVSSGKDGLLRVVYPSISATELGRLLGRVMESIPTGIGNIKFSYLLFGLPVAGLALPGYLAQKITGERYILSTKHIGRWAAFGVKQLQQVNLSDLGDVVVETLPGQEFYDASDLVLFGNDGKQRMRLSGVPRAVAFRELILKAKLACVQVEESLTRIRARQTAAAK